MFGFKLPTATRNDPVDPEVAVHPVVGFIEAPTQTPLPTHEPPPTDVTFPPKLAPLEVKPCLVGEVIVGDEQSIEIADRVSHTGLPNTLCSATENEFPAAYPPDVISVVPEPALTGLPDDTVEGGLEVQYETHLPCAFVEFPPAASGTVYEIENPGKLPTHMAVIDNAAFTASTLFTLLNGRRFV